MRGNDDHRLRSGLQLVSRSLLALRLLIRALLALLRLPLLFHILSFALLFPLVLNKLLLHLEGVWTPAFPTAWTLWIAFLCTLPSWAAVQLVALLVLFFSKRPAAGRSCKLWTSVQNGYISLNTRPSGDHSAVRPPSPMYQIPLSTRSSEDGIPFSHPHSPTYHLRPRLPSPSTLLLLLQCALYLSVLALGLYEYKHHEHPADVRFRPALRAALADPHPNPAGYAPIPEKIFIAAAFHQNEAVIPYWTRSIHDVILYLGTANVFVSIVENYSSDRSPDLLRAFARELDALGVKNRVLVQDHTVKRPQHLAWNPRIEFLAAIRNQALEPLVQLGGYDRVLFSNDIFVEPESVLELLATAGGAYDFACGLDFGHFGAYDMWVLRDRAGRLAAGIWPYFFDTASYEAVKHEEPVPVQTCWNGIVAFAADPLLPVHLRTNRTLSHAPLARPPPANHPWAARLGASPADTPPLRFRASAEGECYSSESFLLPYDFRRIMGLERVFVNPLVINGYVWKYYVWHKWVLRQRMVKWFVERVWDGAWMQYARMVVGDPKKVWVWDGIECHPW